MVTLCSTAHNWTASAVQACVFFLLLNKRVAAQKGNLTIENLNNDVMSVFKMTGFDKLFNIK